VTRNDERRREQLAQIGALVTGRKRRAKLLEEIAWPREVEEAFFAAGCERLPEVVYAIDRPGIEAHVAALDAAERKLDGDDSVTEWLRSTLRSLIDGNRLMLAAGSREFYLRSRELYGSARSPFYGGPVRNINLAEHLLDRLRIHGWDEARDPEIEPISAEELRAMLEARVARREPALDIEVVLDERATAKVVAGMSRVRIRPDASFTTWEAEGLWHHEIETHALTAQNGAAQTEASFLRSGGPRTTRTQEGLAVFSELYNKTLSVKRLERLAVRVKLVDMAEQGASFLDLHRYLVAAGASPRDAYFDAQRVCRGGLCEGGAPFTKDACYLAGLLEVYAFLAAVTRGGFRDEIELLVCGRIALDDIAVLAELRAAGLLRRPRYLPAWLSDWQTLLPYFAFTSFMDSVDLAPVEGHYRALIKLAEAAAPRSR
jgi:uncharacterized protein (TIGR02421 family)